MLRLSDTEDLRQILSSVIKFVNSLDAVQYDDGLIYEFRYYEEGFYSIHLRMMETIYIKDNVISTEPLGDIKGQYKNINACYHKNCWNGCGCLCWRDLGYAEEESEWNDGQHYGCE